MWVPSKVSKNKAWDNFKLTPFPSQDIALLEDQIAGESSDDSDFVVEDKKASKKSAENSDNVSSDSDDDEDSDDSDNSSDEDETDSLEGEAANLNKVGEFSMYHTLEKTCNNNTNILLDICSGKLSKARLSSRIMYFIYLNY